MAGEIEEPFRFNFQADLLHSGSISFGRFESESLSWERRSSFSHNRYLEEVKKYSKPGSVTEKKTYFEAHFRRKALLKQSSSESQDLQEPHNGYESNHFTCFDESPRSSNHSKYDEEINTHKCVKENVETLCSENRNESNHVTILDEGLCDLSYEGNEILDHMVSGPKQLKLEETHQTGTDNVVLVKSIISNEASKAKTKHAAEMKQQKPKLKPHASYDQVQRIISSEASKTKTKESNSLCMKEKEKKSPRYSSPVTHLVRKFSTSEESSMSFPKAKILPLNKSIVKDYRSEKTAETKSSVLGKSLPGARQTVNRTKQAFITPSKPKPHVNQSAVGFTFMSEQRIERRKEEKKAAAEMIQSRKSLNFKATPLPSFYKESSRCSDQNKVSTSKTPNRPQTSSMIPTTYRISTASSNPRPISSTSLTNKNHPSELPTKSSLPEKRVQEKKKDLNSQKPKEPEVTKGTRARDTLRRNGPKLVST